jgi:hypothetical protein
MNMDKEKQLENLAWSKMFDTLETEMPTRKKDRKILYFSLGAFLLVLGCLLFSSKPKVKITQISTKEVVISQTSALMNRNQTSENLIAENAVSPNITLSQPVEKGQKIKDETGQLLNRTTNQITDFTTETTALLETNNQTYNLNQPARTINIHLGTNENYNVEITANTPQTIAKVYEAVGNNQEQSTNDSKTEIIQLLSKNINLLEYQTKPIVSAPSPLVFSRTKPNKQIGILLEIQTLNNGKLGYGLGIWKNFELQKNSKLSVFTALEYQKINYNNNSLLYNIPALKDTTPSIGRPFYTYYLSSIEQISLTIMPEYQLNKYFSVGLGGKFGYALFGQTTPTQSTLNNIAASTTVSQDNAKSLSQTPNELGIMELDPRLLLSLKYQIANRWKLSLNGEYGFNIYKDQSSELSNSCMSLGLQFRIK